MKALSNNSLRDNATTGVAASQRPQRNDDRWAVVEVVGVTLERARLPILRDIQITLRQGKTVAIMGPNGAGKSTLLRCLASVIRPTQGRICWFGQFTEPCADVRRQIGFVGHECRLYRELTALENLVFAARMYGVAQPCQRAAELIIQAGLESAARRAVGSLSQGMCRRLDIARAIIHDPTLILLDEPFSSLDRSSCGWLESLCDRWKRERRTVCLASHDERQSRLRAERIVWLAGGRIATGEAANPVGAVARQIA